MAKYCYVTEYKEMAKVQGSKEDMAAPQEPEITTQKLDFTAGAAASLAFNEQTRIIRVHPDSICSFLVSTAGTAATISNKRITAGATEYFGVNPGDKLSAIANT